MPQARYEIKDIRRVVKDVGTGKQTQDTLNVTRNLVPLRNANSLTTRYGYTTGLTFPAAVSTLQKHLTFPVTYPSATDVHLAFYTTSGAVKKIGAKPFYHNGSSAGTDDNGWVDLAQSVDLSGITNTDVTVNASPTNTVVVVHATDTYGLSATSHYYKNWKYYNSTGHEKLIKDYTLSGTTATFTLTDVVGLTAANFVDVGTLRRYSHDKTNGLEITPTFGTGTQVCGYSSYTAVRFSGGNGSTVGTLDGNTLMWYGYLNKVFFSSDSTNKHTFTGSYADMARITKPDSTTLSVTATQKSGFSTTDIIAAEANRSFNGTPDWTDAGTGQTSSLESWWGNNALRINTTADNSSGTGYVDLAAGKTNSLTNGYIYTVHVRYYPYSATNQNTLKFIVNGQTLTMPLASPFPSGSVYTGTLLDAQADFTSNATSTTELRMYLEQIGTIAIDSVSISLTSDNGYALPTNKTIRYYATYEYDGSQESDPTYLAQQFLTYASPTYSVLLKIKFGCLNKRITAINSYCTLEDDNTTLSSNTTRTSPLYFMHRISIADDDTNWAMNATTGNYEYTDNITGFDFLSVNKTWEQNANRIEATSFTCSPNIALNVAGRIFLAQDYDYIYGIRSTNRIRFSNVNGYGTSCPDIFCDIDDEFIATIDSGSSNNITSLREYNGSLIIGKDSSTIRLNVSDEKRYWTPQIISNSIGVYNDYVMQNVNGSLVWTDPYNIYAWNGGTVKVLGDEVWATWYRANSTSGQFAFFNRIDQSYNLSYKSSDGTLLITMYEGMPYPYQHVLTNAIIGAVSTKDGSVYSYTSAGVSYLFNTSYTDNGTNLTVIADTGQFEPAINKIVRVLDVQADVDISGTVSTSYTIQVYVDNTVVCTGTIADATKKLYRFLSDDTAGRYVRIVIQGATSSSTIVNAIGFTYQYEDTYGDNKQL